MATSTKIKGVALTLSIGTPPVDYQCDVLKCSITNEDASGDDVVTFCDVGKGVRQYYLNLAAIQSTDTESLWRYIWDHVGEKVAFTYAPHGNAVATESQPHFIGTVKVGPRPEIGGEAGAKNTYTFESQWEIDGEPVLDTGV